MLRLDKVFRMGHQAQNIATVVDDARDVVDRPVGVGAFGIAEDDLAFALDAGECVGIGEIIAVMVGYGHRITCPGL